MNAFAPFLIVRNSVFFVVLTETWYQPNNSIELARQGMGHLKLNELLSPPSTGTSTSIQVQEYVSAKFHKRCRFSFSTFLWSSLLNTTAEKLLKLAYSCRRYHKIKVARFYGQRCSSICYLVLSLFIFVLILGYY